LVGVKEQKLPMKLKSISRYLRFGAVACLALFCLSASEHHGTVKFGTVPIPGATVTATKGDKKAVAITDENGVYIFPDLEDGVWKMQVEMLTFSTATKDIGVSEGAPPAEWALTLQSMDQIKATLQTAAAAPTATPAPGTASAAATAPSTNPTPTAAAPAAATETAAATPAKPPAKGKKGATAPTTPQAGFQRTDVNAAADAPAPSGAAAAGPPSIASSAEAVQNSSDAFVVNGSTSNGIERRAIGNGRKGPRSLFSGGIDFRNFESDVLDARSYSTTGQDTPRSPYNHFTVSGQLQGPLWVPHLFRWAGNFYVQYQTSRLRNAQSQPFTMPSAAERAGDFSQVTNAAGSPLNLVDPTTLLPLPNDIIPASRISPQAKYLLGYYPQPQFSAPGVTYNYQVPLVSRSTADQFVARVNKTINNKSSLQSIFAYQNNTSQNNNVVSFVDNTHTSNYHGQTALTRTFTRTFYGRFSVDYTRSSVLTTPFFANTTNVSGEAGIMGNDQTPLDWGPPSLGFTGSGIYGLSDPATARFVRNTTTAFSAILTYIRRPQHNFQFGGDFKVQDLSTVGQSNGRGSFGFTGAASGFDFADFLFGIPDTSSIAFGNADKYLRSNWYDAFINDDWRVSSSFTLNWGVRWDYTSPFTEEYGRLVNLDIAPGFTSSAPVIANSPVGSLSGMHYPSSLINPDKHEVSPRISFAWRPIFGSNLLVRGAYGLYYNTSVYAAIASLMAQQSPLSKSLNVANSAADPLTLANGFIASPNVTTNTFAVDPNYRVGYSQNYSLSVQQNVTASLVLTAMYFGVRGTRAAQEFQPNTYPIGAANPCQSCLPGYTYLTSNGNSNRNAGQLLVRRRFHGGVSTNFTYTYSKAIDDAGSLGSSFGSIAQNWLNLSAERGLSSFDQRHNFTAALQYSTGVGVRGGALLGGWRGTIIKGWTFQSNITAGSGLPLTPSYALATPLIGTSGTLRPEYVGGNIYAGIPGRFLNAAAYAAPPLGQWGDAARDSITGPNQFSMNGTMSRSFVEKYTLTFSANNVLNHPMYSGWNTTFNPALANGGPFGQLLPPGSMRQVTASFRWTF
jgi:trimeric autotransporter adhesin